MAKKKVVEVYHLICQDCKESNYVVRLSKENKGLEKKKYCPRTRNVQSHKAKKA
jgi:ribosomal protein L33